MNWVKLLVDFLLAAVTVLTGAGVVVPLWGLALVLRSVRPADPRQRLSKTI